MARNNGGIVVWNNQDTVPTDGQGGYSGGDSTAAAMALAGGQAQAALTTMENLKVAVNHLPSTSGPTIAISGSVPARTITIGVPAGKDGAKGADGMGYAQGQQLLADSAAVKTDSAQVKAESANILTLAQQAQAAAYATPDQANADILTNRATLTRQALRDLVGAYNVRDFGAIGDGVTDDTANIQACLNAAKTKGMAVWVPAGTYRITGSLYPLKLYGGKVRIYGSGDASVLKAESSDGTLLAVSGGVSIDSLKFDGSFEPSSGTANYLSLVNLDSDCTMTRCAVTRAQGSSITAVGRRIAITNCRLDKFGDHAIYSAQSLSTTAPYEPNGLCSDIVIAGNTITDDPTYHNAAGDPVRGTIKLRGNVERVTISGNTVRGDQCVTIDADWRRPEACPRGVLITGNMFTSTWGGIAAYTASYTGVADTGIRVRDVTITGNSFISATGTGDYGIFLSRSQVTATGNTFSCGGAAVAGAAGIDGGASLISGNMFRLTTSAGCILLGTGTVIAGNVFTGVGTYSTWLTYRNVVRGNSYQGVNEGVRVDHNPANVADASLIAGNEIRATTGIIHVNRAGVYARLVDNTILGATTNSVRVFYGADFNKGLSSGNRVVSGPALPTQGSADSVALAAPTASWP